MKKAAKAIAAATAAVNAGTLLRRLELAAAEAEPSSGERSGVSSRGVVASPSASASASICSAADAKRPSGLR